MKLNETEITTKNVYLNIINSDSVNTLTLETNEAIKLYGDYELATPILVEENEDEDSIITSIALIAKMG
jgi:hypothetical protein